VSRIACHASGGMEGGFWREGAIEEAHFMRVSGPFGRGKAGET